MSVCPACGHGNQPGAKFCSECGAALAGDRPLAQEERKVVTVLFAALVGFTSRAEQLDPEDVRALLSPYYARLRAELERFGGTVEKFIGDAVMALFGAPVTHEDDPERAVRAALAIRDWIAEEAKLQVRIAVNTGEALVNLGARPEAGGGVAARGGGQHTGPPDAGPAGARDARRRPRHRQEPARRGAVPVDRPRRRADVLAAGTVVAVRAGRQLLGARGDGESAGGDPGNGRRGRGRRQARADGRAADPPGRGVGALAPASAGWPGERSAGLTGGSVRRLEPLLGSPRGAVPARARVRGHPV